MLCRSAQAKAKKKKKNREKVNDKNFLNFVRNLGHQHILENNLVYIIYASN